MEFAKFVEWCFYGIVGSACTYGAYSIAQLNTNLAVIIEKMLWHEKIIDRHEQEIEELKKK